MTGPSIILFDGVCNLCNGFVNFVIDRDRSGRFRFGSLQSESARHLINKFPESAAVRVTESSDDKWSVVLLEDDKVYTRSGAVLRIFRKMGGGWPLMFAFIIIPPFLRDAVYGLVARNRYKWFGKRETCRIPTPELKARFID